MKVRLLALGIIGLVSALAIACGSDNAAPAGEGGGNAAGILPAEGELIAPGQYLTFDGERYELVNLLFEDSVGDEMVAVGEASGSDVDLPEDRRVFKRGDEQGVVYTYAPATVEDPGYWLVWRLVV